MEIYSWEYNFRSWCLLPLPSFVTAVPQPHWNLRCASAPTDDVTKVCVILASHPPKPSPPSLLSSLPFSSSPLIPGSLFVSQFPCVFVPNLLPRLLSCLSSLSPSLSSLSFSVSLSSSNSPPPPQTSRLVFGLVCPPPSPPPSIPHSSSFPAIRCAPSLRLVVLSNQTQAVRHRQDVRSDEERKWGCVGST